MKTIKNTDLSGEYQTKLENHLKSDDFFSVEKNPTAIFAISSVTALADGNKEGNNFTLAGSLTIKGITNEISFPAKINFDGNDMSAAGTATIDRSKYNVRYGSTSFFDDLGDKAIYDEFKLNFNIKASK